MGEIIHIAGPVCTYGSVARQRCQWCGALIQEYDLERIAVQEDFRDINHQGTPLDFEELGWWDGLVEISGSNPRILRSVDPEPGEEVGYSRAPERSCMKLFDKSNPNY